jgi:heptosyltransferase-3
MGPVRHDSGTYQRARNSAIAGFVFGPGLGRFLVIPEAEESELPARAQFTSDDPPAPKVERWLRLRVGIRHAMRFVRHRLRRLSSAALTQLVGPRSDGIELQPRDIHSVLICRINARIGNTLFLTPLIRRIHELLPHAAIDLVLAYPQAEELLAEFPGLRSIILVPLGSSRKLWRYFAVLRRLRACRYDLAIDPVRESMSGRIAISLCRAQHRLGYASESQWAPLTHAVTPLPGLQHHAIEPVFLLSRVFGVPCEIRSLRICLPLRDDELAAGNRIISEAIARVNPLATAAQAFGFFSHAAGLKPQGRDWWLAFWNAFLALEPEAVPLECLPSCGQAPVDARFASFHAPSARLVSAAIASTRMFVSSDTGPMHLASATNVPTVALFRASSPELYGPLKPTDLAIDTTLYSPAAVARRCQQIWRNRTPDTR